MSAYFLFAVLLVHLSHGQIPPNGTVAKPPNYAFNQFSIQKGTPPGPLSRSAVGFSPDGQLAYIIGGENGAGVTTQNFYTFDFNSSQWSVNSVTRLFSGPCYAQYAAPKPGVNSDIWLYSKTDGINAQLARFNYTSIHVVSRESPQVPSDGGCAVTSAAHFYVFGGSEGNTCTNGLHYNNGTTWNTVDTSNNAQLPAKRANAGLVSLNHTHLYLFGGICGEVEVDNDLWFVDVQSGVWTKVEVNGDKPLPRHSHALSFDFSSPVPRLLLFGGKTSNSTFDDAWRFDVVSGVWTQLTHNVTQEWPTARSHFGHAFFGGRFIAFGGGDTKGTLNNELWQLVLNDDCFARKTCEECVTGVIGCGWCSNNEKGFKCIAGAEYGSFLAGSCVNSSATTWTVEFLTCPLDEFPGWIIALVIIGCIVLVGVIIYFVMRRNQKASYEIIA